MIVKIDQYLNWTDYNPRRITKAGKDFTKKLDFKDIKFPVKIGDMHKTEKKNCIGISVWGYENKKDFPIYVPKKVLWRKTCWFIINRRRKKEKLYSYQRF